MGAISEPCCIRLPITNQKELCRLHWLTKYLGSSIQGYGLVHSSVHSLPMINIEMAVVNEAAISISQTSGAKGSANEKKLGGAFVGFW